MTKQLLLAGVAAMFAASASAVSQIPDDGTIENYAISAKDMSGLHFGVMGRGGERTVKEGRFEGALKESRVNAYLGYDLFRWLTVYGFVGISETKSDDFRFEGDTAASFGGGAWLYLLDDDQLDIMSTFSRFRVNLGAEYAFTDSNELALGQTEAFLTFELLNDTFLVHDMYPSSIGVFAGPVFSYLHGEEIEQDASDAWGFTVGLTLTFSRRTYATVGIDLFSDDNVVYAAAGIRF